LAEKYIQMTDRYALLTKNQKLSENVFGLKYDLLNSLLVKVQLLNNKKLEENPISKRGLNAKFTFENQFLLTMEYLRTYQTFEVLAFSYGISESYASKCYHKILTLLYDVIGLKKGQKISYKKVKDAIIDVTCQPIERPVKSQKSHYNRYKKTTFQKYN
jgi:hypothetical protein